MKLGMRVLGGISAVVCLSPVMVVAQAGAQDMMTPAPIDCAAERSEAAGARIRTLDVQARQALEAGNLPQAAQSLAQFFQAVGRIPSQPDRAAALESTLVSIDANQSLMEQMVEQAAAANQPAAVTSALAEAARSTQSISSGYGAAKTRILTAIARYSAQLGQPQQSRIALAEALRATLSIQGAAFQANAQTDIAAAYLDVDEPQSAAVLLDQAQRYAQQIDNPQHRSRAFERLAVLYAAAGQLDRAQQAAQQIEAAPYDQASAVRAIVEKYVEAGSLDAAAELAQTIQQPDAKAQAIAAIAGRYFTVGETEQADALFAQAVEMARSTDNPHGTAAAAALEYAKFGNLDTALATVRAIDDPFVKTSALGSMALLYARADRAAESDAVLAEALQTLAAIADGSSFSGARQLLIDQAVQAGRFDLAVRVAQTPEPHEQLADRVDLLRQLSQRATQMRRFDAVLQVAQALPGDIADERNNAILPAVIGYAAAGDFDAAQAAAEQIAAGTSHRARAFAAIAGAQAAAGQAAAPLLERAQQEAEALAQPEHRAEAIAAIAAAYGKAQQPQAASAALSAAIAAIDALPDAFSRSYALRTITEQLLLSHDYAIALETAAAIPDRSEQLWKLNQVAEEALKAGEHDIVLAAVNRLDEPASQTRWLLALVDRQIAQGESAAPLLAQALQTARTIEGDESKVIVLRADYDGEGNVISQTIVDDDQDRGSYLEAIALRHAQLGQVPQALQVAQLLQDANWRDRVVQRVRCHQ